MGEVGPGAQASRPDPNPGRSLIDRIVPQGDPDQTHRMHRYLVAGGASFIVLFLFYLYHLVGMMQGDAIINLAIATVAGNAVFYASFQIGRAHV